MADFTEALKTDKNLQQQVAEAIKQVAQKNNLTFNEKLNDAPATADDDCNPKTIGWTLACTF